MIAATLDTYQQFIAGRTPRRQLGGPQDLKGAVLLFASDASAHINGQSSAVDGGSLRLDALERLKPGEVFR